MGNRILQPGRYLVGLSLIDRSCAETKYPNTCQWMLFFFFFFLLFFLFGPVLSAEAEDRGLYRVHRDFSYGICGLGRLEISSF